MPVRPFLFGLCSAALAFVAAVALAGATGAFVAAPLLAAVAAAVVAQRAAWGAAAWWLFALAALFGAVAPLAGAGLVATGDAPFHAAAVLALAAGVMLLIYPRSSGRAPEAWLDLALLSVAALAAALAVAARGTAATPVGVLALTAALWVTLPSALLVVTWTRSPAWRVALGVGAAALLQLPLAVYAVTGAVPALAGHAAMVGWSGLLCAAAWLLRADTEAAARPNATAAGNGMRLLRELAAPAAALVLGGMLLGGTTAPPVAAVLGVLGLLLAARASLLLRVSRRQSAERRELAQSRALVEVSQALAAGSTELDETLQLVTDWAARLFDARGAAIELLVEEDTVLLLHSAHGLPASLIGLRSPVATTFTGWVVRHGRSRSTLDPRTEEDMAPAGLPALGSSPVAAAPLRFRGRTLGVLACIGRRPFDAADMQMLGALAEQAAIAIENARLFLEVRTLSMTDPLTALPNRRQLDRDLQREFAAAQRGRRLVAVLFDLDEFKAHNDQYGHAAGDAALCLFADVLTSLTRRENLAVRLGGDEFLALLTDTDRRGAATFVERVRERFAARMAERGHLELTVAAGFAEYAPDMATSEELIAAADRALYNNKPVRPRT